MRPEDFLLMHYYAWNLHYVLHNLVMVTTECSDGGTQSQPAMTSDSIQLGGVAH